MTLKTQKITSTYVSLALVDVIRYPHSSSPSSHALSTPPALAACEFPRLYRELDAMYRDLHGAIITIPQLVNLTKFFKHSME